VTATARLLGAVLLRAREGEAPVVPRPSTPSAQLAVAGALGLVIVLAGASLSRQGMSERFEDNARADLPEHPARAIRDADRSLRLDRESVPTYYVKAAAEARLNRGGAAEATLLQAAAKEPSDFVTWALLGDLAVRRGELASAEAYYERGVKLNPREPSLRELARNPSAAPR
jgi:cytochrome c-type biogenesis protein CcmH/NrfG